MTANERRLEGSESNQKLIIVIAVGAAVVIAVVFYIFMRASAGSGGREPTLEGAIRPGSPEFAQVHEKIVMDEPEADESKRALGDIVMKLQTTVRNFSGKTLNGLEVRAAVVDHQGKAVKEKTVIVIPTRQPELANNKTMLVWVSLEGMTDTDDRANIKMEITGFKFKE